MSGTDAVTARPGFKAMLERVASNGAKTIFGGVADRFARDVVVQETGYQWLHERGIALVPATAPDYFTTETPTSKLIRHDLGCRVGL